MANSIIGAGIIGLPFAFSCTGYLLGVILLVGLAVVVDWTIRLIVINAKLTGKSTYQETVEATFGQPGLIAVSLAQVLFAFGGMVSFCVIIGDTIPEVVAAIFPHIRESKVVWIVADRKFVIVACTCLISYPLSLYKDITKLAGASALALISMCLIITTVVFDGPQLDPEYRRQLAPYPLIIELDSIKAISIISFAFVCHHNSLLIYSGLHTPTIDRFAIVTHISTAVSTLACLIMALAGYLVFGEKTRGNILNNFPVHSSYLLVTIARFCFGFNCFTTLPIELFVCREVVVNYFYEPRVPHRPFTDKQHIIITSAFVFGAMLLSLLVHNLEVVLDLTGGTSACVLAYILPPLCYVKVSKAGPENTKARILAWACIVFGVVIMIMSLVRTLFLA